MTCKCEQPRYGKALSDGSQFCWRCHRQVAPVAVPRVQLEWRRDHGALCCCFDCVMKRGPHRAP